MKTFIPRVPKAWRALATVPLLGLSLTSGCSQSAPPPPPVRYQVVTNFDHQGSNPTGLVQGRDGNLYGTFESGGPRWEGVVFRVKPDGSEYSIVHDFGTTRRADCDKWPQGVLEGKDGALYGTTRLGGPPAGDEFPLGCGIVFKVNRDGSAYQILHHFSRSADNGNEPWAGLVEDPAGVLYGTTLEGGSNGGGVVFRLNRDGSGFAILHHFQENENDGGRPMAGLLYGGDGVLYGTTDSGGNSTQRNGTVFRINPDGTDYRVLHSFPSVDGDGRTPRAALVEGPDQMVYGTTRDGGRRDGGTVFRMGRDGSRFQVLHRFNGSPEMKADPTGKIEMTLKGVTVMAALESDGGSPMSLVFGKEGLLYGFAENRGKNGAGTVFRIQCDGGGFETLHHFLAVDGDGKDPAGRLAQGSDGAVYGLTINSVTNNCSSLYRLSLLPTPPARTTEQ
ncbi:MAG: hypothetical protein RIS76_1191 [Verrucomicrobiota bacterium]